MKEFYKVGDKFDKDWTISRIYEHDNHYDLDLLKNDGEQGYKRIMKKDIKAEKQIIMIHESLISSILKDTFSFTCFSTLLYFNYKYFGNHVIIALVFVLMIFIMMITRTKNNNKEFKTFYSKKDALKWLQDK